MLRTDKQVQKFLRKAKDFRKLVAAICHGPQVLISGGMYPLGTRATGVDDILGDMTNAGFTVLNEAVVYDADQRLITSRGPHDLEDFCVQIGIRLLEAAPITTSMAP